MKADIHPKNYRPVVFEDATSGKRFLFGSTIRAEERGTWDDGNEYDKVTVEISSASHPFYTGKETTIDTAGRVDKFRKRQEAAKAKAGK
ncbi:type B 50S ribosomal protein L31 [Patescibacteria group bacterium]|nr:type B 50S ribosomal protein L31 [Patescibacteria group bacterium]